VTSAVREAFAEQRARDRALRVVRRRRPVPAVLGQAAARALGRLERSRAAVLQLSGLGLLDAAAWQLGTIWGLAAAGVALLFVDWLNGDPS